ncbi:MAG: tyrosine-type recombinase/integrase [Acetobacter sp.]|nr:tyrosine-type recombinase/integrase [Bacteroides sp.]MCM1340564.1 tyrosine-type recombinase/integrase [Acetobacter sp.]MCM1433304.1 tyrosine-type recombinase/integrase [Clostridiales bacterium]
MRKDEISQLPKLVQQYLVYIEAIKNHSQLSVLEYASDLRTFFRYLAKYKGLCSVDTDEKEIDLSPIDLEFIQNVNLNDAYQFIIYCKTERNNNETTRARRVVAIRRFYSYLTDNLGVLENNPMKALEAPRTKKALPKYLTLEEANMLLNVIDGKFKERDYAIITLFLNCGMRLSELVSIDYNDIKADGSLVITGKGNKQRTIYLNQACIDAIIAYMKVRPNDKVKDKALFLSSRNQRISNKTVQHLVYDYLAKAGFADRGLSVHKLRHTAATLMYQHGHVDLLLLKEILGHENLGTTEIYTHTADEAARKAMDSNPLADNKPKW